MKLSTLFTNPVQPLQFFNTAPLYLLPFYDLNSVNTKPGVPSADGEKAIYRAASFLVGMSNTTLTSASIPPSLHFIHNPSLFIHTLSQTLLCTVAATLR